VPDGLAGSLAEVQTAALHMPALGVAASHCLQLMALISHGPNAQLCMQDILIGLLRLRKASGPDSSRQPELVGRCSVVRELHVYGTAVAVHARDSAKFQHQVCGGCRLAALAGPAKCCKCCKWPQFAERFPVVACCRGTARC
jgi:hypothetical protein